MSNDDDEDREQAGGGAAAAQHAEERQARPTARSTGKGGLAPRGRTPSEILARKQKILSSSSSSPSSSTSASTPDRINEQTSGEAVTSPGEAVNGVETKLESLSRVLREHQQQREESNSSLAANNNNQVKSIDDVYILLAKKDKDLQLAAELGKVLLERNDELSKQNEKITEEYSHKLELLEEDRHKLKRKLNLLDGEYENRLVELQTDCNILKNQLEKQQQVTKQVEKEKSRLIDDLVQQNQRLTSELVEATKSEELLSSQLEQVNERAQARHSNRQDHVAQVDGLKEEIQILNQRKQDLERRLRLAQQDKSGLSGQLDELGDKLLLLESLLNEKDAKSNELLVEINELRDSSSWLSNKLELMISLNERLATTTDPDRMTDDLRLSSERERSQLVEQLKELRFKRTSRMKANELMLASATKPSWPVDGRRRKSRQPTRRRRPTSASDDESRDDDDDDDGRQQQERHETPNDLLCDIFLLLRKFQLSLQQRKENIQFRSNGTLAKQQQQQLSTNNDDSGISTSDGDSSSTADRRAASDLGEWRQLLASLRTLLEDMPCTNCHLMIGERADYEQLQKLYAKLNDQLRKKNDEALRFHSDNIELKAKLEATGERCQMLANDLENCDTKTKEEIVKLAWKARDEAVARKNAAEIGLAKTRIENMQISSQLMEVVQQKGELSQRLAQFEDDIHYITQHSVRAKFTWEEYAEQMRRSNNSGATDQANNKQTGNNLQSLSYSSINPLINQLLNFSSKADQSTTAAASSLSPRQPNNHEMDNGKQASLATKFTSKLNLSRFWQQRSSSSQPSSPIKTIVENN